MSSIASGRKLRILHLAIDDKFVDTGYRRFEDVFPEQNNLVVCTSSNKLDFIKTRKVFECRQCHRQIYATAGTIFHKSRVPLR